MRDISDFSTGLALLGAVFAVTCAVAQPPSAPSPVSSRAELATTEVVAHREKKDGSNALETAEPQDAELAEESVAASQAGPYAYLSSKLKELKRLDNIPNGLVATNSAIASNTVPRVRVLWFGDSHSAADFWVEPVRLKLQERYGDGGPGYFAIGNKSTRHAAYQTKIDGRYTVRPKQPDASSREGDGVFGLAGLKIISGDTSERLSLTAKKIRSDAQATIWVKFPKASSSLNVEFGKSKQTLARMPNQQSYEPLSGELSLGSDIAASSIYHFNLPYAGVPSGGVPNGGVPNSGSANTAPPNDRSGAVDSVSSAPANVGTGAAPQESPYLKDGLLKIDNFKGGPELLGASIEYGRGVVVDTLGLNGARISTPTAWETSAWEAMVAERDPALVILAYGTNEAGDRISMDRYAGYYREVLRRIREAAPQTSCLLVGPTDRADGNGGSLARVVELDEMQARVAAELGCDFFSVFNLMGGVGGYHAWSHQKPALARGDRVHLSVDGYRVVGQAIAQYLLEQLDKY